MCPSPVKSLTCTLTWIPLLTLWMFLWFLLFWYCVVLIIVTWWSAQDLWRNVSNYLSPCPMPYWLSKASPQQTRCFLLIICIYIVQLRLLRDGGQGWFPLQRPSFHLKFHLSCGRRGEFCFTQSLLSLWPSLSPLAMKEKPGPFSSAFPRVV